MNCMWNILTNPTDLTLLSVVRSLYILTVTSKKHALTQRADRIEALAKQLSLSNNVNGIINFPNSTEILELSVQPFVDPDPFQELTFLSLML